MGLCPLKAACEGREPTIALTIPWIRSNATSMIGPLSLVLKAGYLYCHFAKAGEHDKNG
jgi:hypothetical protein